MKSRDLESWLNKYLNIHLFSDYAPNGLQVEATEAVQKVIFAVSASMEAIEQAIEKKADALIVHHGFFWKGENPTLTGLKGKRVRALMQNKINLLAYHLPLDAHQMIGNNIGLAQMLGIKNPKPIKNSLIWQGNWSGSLDKLGKTIEQKLNRKPLIIQTNNPSSQKVAFCTGAAQGMMNELIGKKITGEIEVDAFISGEISERTVLIARESQVHYIAAGHHATETFGVESLSQVVQKQLNLKTEFINIPNPA